ncbi:hypothetical protein BZG36_00321 [Bifiguratus adelaidae]|uniref:BZIP domain-containing protein n=1 Tax=Bifiguratus adelaidae TaxID=1938954 RepID=A0A261Y7U9_9FUNG|nr:hypothetical protein BZG36_00321 [Bifiguratus adelaidae]
MTPQGGMTQKLGKAISTFSEAVPTPTRFLMECGEMYLTPSLGLGWQELNPFEDSFRPKENTSAAPVSTPIVLPPTPGLRKQTTPSMLTADMRMPPTPTTTSLALLDGGQRDLLAVSMATPILPPLSQSTLALPNNSQTLPYPYASQFPSRYTSSSSDVPPSPELSPPSSTGSPVSSNMSDSGQMMASAYPQHNQQTYQRSSMANDSFRPSLPSKPRTRSSQSSFQANTGAAGPTPSTHGSNSTHASNELDIHFYNAMDLHKKSSFSTHRKPSMTVSRPSSQRESTFIDYEDEVDPVTGKRRRVDEENEEEKRRKFLERNRVAASKCRKKKKIWMQQLESRAQEVSLQNRELHMLVNSLKDDIITLKNELLAHRDRECKVIQQYVQTSGHFSASLLNGHAGESDAVTTTTNTKA